MARQGGGMGLLHKIGLLRKIRDAERYGGRLLARR